MLDASAASAANTSIATFKTFPQGVQFDMTEGYDAPPLLGRVTSPYLNSASEMVEFFLQDATGGIRVRGAEGGYFFNAIPGAPTAIAGLEVRVEYLVRLVVEDGELIAELEDPAYSLIVTGSAAVPPQPAPSVVTAAQVLSGAYDGRLVRVNGVQSSASFTWPPNQDNQNGTVHDATGSLTLFVDRDTPLAGQTPPPVGLPFDLIGIVDVGSAATPGQRLLMPRTVDDLMLPEIANEAPTLTAPARVVGAPGVEVLFDIQGADINPQDTLTFAASSAPAGATLTVSGTRVATFRWTPSAGDEGEHTVVFTVTDGALTNAATTVIDIRSLSGGPDHPWINEFHYDNVGTDIGEGLELAGRAGIDLSAYAVYTYTNALAGAPGYFYNGPIAVSNSIPDETGNGYGAVWIPRVLNNGGDARTARTAGLCLVYTDPATGTPVVQQFLSYEGAFTAVDGPAAGLVSFDVGVAEGASTPVGRSLYLIGNGNTVNARYEQFVWTGPGLATPGRINNGQAFGGIGGQATVTVGRPSPAPSVPTPAEPFNVTLTYTRSYTASDLSATLFYTTDDWASTNAIAMSSPGTELTDLFTTIAPVPGQPLGTTVSFFVELSFSGNQASSPVRTEIRTLNIRWAVAFQGFEGSASDTWRYTPIPNGGSIRTVSDPVADGSYALQLGGQGAFLDPASVDFQNAFVQGYSNVSLSVAYAAKEVDNADYLLLKLSYDGGATWATNIVLVSGYNSWSFGFGTTLPETVRPFTADTNPFTLAIPADATQVKVRLTNSGSPSSSNFSDYFFIDSVALTAVSGSLVSLPPAFEPVAANWTAEATRTNVFTVSAYDPNGGAVSLVPQTGLPLGGSFTTATSNGVTVGTFTYVPLESDVGHAYPLTFAATDGDGTTTASTVVTVITPFTGCRWTYDDGTPQGWYQARYGNALLPLWDWDVYPDALGNQLSSGPGVGASNTTYYAGINGYSATDPQPVDAWWISPVIDARHMATPRLSFAAWFSYTGSNLVVYATTDTGATPDSPTWTVLPTALPTVTGWRFCETSLVGWTNVPFRVAFRYTATGGSGGSKTWAVDSIMIDDKAVAPPPEPPPPPTASSGSLIISEYGEGASYNKYVELFNLSATNLDLSAYSLRKEVNGAGGYAGALPLSGILPPYTAYVIVHSGCGNVGLTAKANLLTNDSAMNFNGNDAIGLFFGSTVDDAVGVLGQAADWGKDVRLVRKSSVTKPRTVYEPTEWTVGAMDDFADVGLHTFDGSENLPTPPPVPTGLTATNVTTVGFTLLWNASAGATGYQVDVASNATFTALLSGYQGVAVAGTSTPVTNLAPATVYWARVRAVSNEMQSASSAAVTTNTLPALLLLSEYGEGGPGNNMYVEIHNPNPVAVALDGYALRKKTSTLTAYGAPVSLSGTLAPGATYVVAHAAASATLRAKAHLVTDADAMNFNGHHAVALFRGATLTDVIGWPSVAWGVDKTFVRRTAIATPNSVYTPAEWTELAADNWTNVGVVGDPPSAPQRQPAAESVALTAGNAIITFTVLPTREDGVTYVLQRSTVPSPMATWSDLPSTLTPLDAATATFTDPTPPPGAAFYRIRATRP